MTPWRTPRKRAVLDLTPLIDVVLTLLLFVVLAAEFSRPGVLDLQLPEGAPRPAPTGLTVEVTAEGPPVLDGEPWPGGDLGPEVARRAGAGAVVVRAGASVPYDRVFRVLDDLAEAGVSTVGLAHETR